ncbi:MAG: MMPL family transporter [Actinomycetota bacterium]|nr:MMPL family transporter [Actinomycetota bacterium]
MLVLVGGIVVAAVSALPSLASSGGGLSGGLVGIDEPAVAAQTAAVRRFGLPLLTRTVVVQRDPAGLSIYAQARVVLRALEVDKRTLVEGPGDGLLLALPIFDHPSLSLVGGPPTTTAITYLYSDPSAGFGVQQRIASDYARTIDRPDDHLAGVTGTIPVQVEQGRLVQEWLPWVELGSVLAIALIVGLSFRSVLAPVITLSAAGIAYLLADRLVGFGAELIGFSAPGQLQPVLVALVLGITTDYAIFFLSGLKRRLRDGTPTKRATRDAVAEYLPTVLVAGLTVGTSVLALSVARTGIFRAFGPGLAITVLAGLLVSVTLVPALLGVLGRWAFWPDSLSQAEPDRSPSRLAARSSSRIVRLVEHRFRAAVVVAVVGGALVAAALPLTWLNDAISPASALPEGNPVRAAADAATAGFSGGILAPTGVIVSAPGVARNTSTLGTLQRELSTQPGVAGVLGPASQPDLVQGLESRLSPVVQARLFIGPGGDAVRYLVAFDSDPLGAKAVDSLRALEQRMPALLTRSGLDGAEVAYAGDTALGLSLADSSRADLGRIALAVGLVDLLLLMLFLRAVVAPLYLLACSFLAVGASLGLTTLFFQNYLGQDGLVFYVPFAGGVLLDSFVVRSFLVPALISLVGKPSGWPGQRLAPRPAPSTRLGTESAAGC